MAIHSHLTGSSYTVKILTPKFEPIARAYHNLLIGLLERTEKLENLHLGLKYLGYDTDYTEEYMETLIPELQDITRRYLPIRLTVQGIAGFWSTPDWQCKPVIFLRVLQNKRLQELHEEIVEELGDRVDTFTFIEGRYYTPHITLGVGKQECESALKNIAESTQQDDKIECTVNKLAMRFPSVKNRLI